MTPDKPPVKVYCGVDTGNRIKKRILQTLDLQDSNFVTN